MQYRYDLPEDVQSRSPREVEYKMRDPSASRRIAQQISMSSHSCGARGVFVAASAGALLIVAALVAAHTGPDRRGWLRVEARRAVVTATRLAIAPWSFYFASRDNATLSTRACHVEAECNSSARKLVIKGINYAPVPSMKFGDVIPDDDFMARDTAPLWDDSGRGDLGIMRALGANAVRLYGNDPRFDHLAFLDTAAKHKLGVIAGISDYPYIQMKSGDCLSTGYNCYKQIKEQYSAMLRRGFLSAHATYHPALHTITLMNEPELKFEGKFQNLPGDPKHFCRALVSAFDAVLDAEREAGVRAPFPNITAPFSFGPCKKCRVKDRPALGQMLELRRAMLHPETVDYRSRNDLGSEYRKRFVNSFNTHNPASDIRPIFLDAYDREFQGTPVFISEYHSPTFFDQSLDVRSILHIARNESTLLTGISFFEFQERYDKGGYELGFGIFGLDNESAVGDVVINNSTYISRCLTRRPTGHTMQCGETMLDMDFFIESNWSKTIDHVRTPGMCCKRCQKASRCRAWTWLRDAGLRPISAGPSQCWLKGNGTMKKVPKSGVVSGMFRADDNSSDDKPDVFVDDVLAKVYGGAGVREKDLCRK